MRRSYRFAYIVMLLTLSLMSGAASDAPLPGGADRSPLDSLTARHAPHFLHFPAFYPGWDEDDSTACLGTSHALHPSVAYVPERFLGYRFWMAYTPICISESDENPHIAVSNDGYTWTPFVTDDHDTLFNPIFDHTQFSATHLSDVDIRLDSLAGLSMVFRATWEIAGIDSHAVYMSRTEDGLNWSDPEKVLSDGLLMQNGPSAFMSPSLTDGPDGALDLYVIEPFATGLTLIDTSRAVRYRADRTGDPFTLLDTCTWSLPSDTLKLWHLDVVPNLDSGLTALVTLSANNRLNYGGLAELYVGESHDSGHTWVSSEEPLLTWRADTTAWYGRAVYRATGFWLPCREQATLQVYYSASARPEWEGGTGTGWQTGVTTASGGDLSIPVCADLEVNGSVENRRLLADTLSFSWTYADPMHADLESLVELELYEDTIDSCGPAWNSGVAPCDNSVYRCTDLTLLPGQTYTGRLRMSNGIAWSSWCSVTFRVNSPPDLPQLLRPQSDSCVLTEMTPQFIWSGGDPDPGDTASYRLVLSTTAELESPWVSPARTDTALRAPDSMEYGRTYWWRIRAEDMLGVTVESGLDSIRMWMPGDIDDDGRVAVTDLVYLADYLFRQGEAPCDMQLGDVTGSCRVDISDLTYMVDLLFRGGPPAIPCHE